MLSLDRIAAPPIIALENNLTKKCCGQSFAIIFYIICILECHKNCLNTVRQFF